MLFATYILFFKLRARLNKKRNPTTTDFYFLIYSWVGNFKKTTFISIYKFDDKIFKPVADILKSKTGMLECCCVYFEVKRSGDTPASSICSLCMLR